MNKYNQTMGSAKAPGPKPKATTSMPANSTAAWPGVPGKTQSSRNNGVQTSGPLGQFSVKKVGL